MRFNFVILFSFFSMTSLAQYDVNDTGTDTTKKEKKVSPYDLKQRIYVGGDFSLRFGTETYIYLAPMIGYDFFPKDDPVLSAGFTTMYQLYRLKYPNGAIVADHAFGGGIFLRYRPFEFLVTQLEFDIYNTTDYSVPFGGRINVPALQLGVGYVGNMSDRAYYNIMLMYDFIHNDNMPLPKLISPIPIYLKYGFVWYLG